MSHDADELQAVALAKATTNTHLAELKAALRERLEAETAGLVSRCLDNAYGHGFCEGALHVISVVPA